MARCTSLFILPRCTLLSKCTCHLLHECPLGNFSWRGRFLGWPGKRYDKARAGHITPHSTQTSPTSSLPPPHLRRRHHKQCPCPPARCPTTTTSSMPRATCPCLTLRHWPGTYKTGRLTVSARQRRRHGTSGSFSGRACSLSNKYGSCSRGTPSSQRVATRSTCFGPFIL